MSEIDSTPIPEEYSVLVIEPTWIRGNKNGINELLILLATALKDGEGVEEFLDPKGNVFDLRVRSCSTTEELEAVSNSDINQDLEAILRQLINKHSLTQILTTLKRICALANQNNPNFDWDTDADAISIAIERVEN